MAKPEAWLRGPLDGFYPVLMPAAHALVQSGEDLERAASELTVEELWLNPGGAASLGFHLRHIAGSIERLPRTPGGNSSMRPSLRPYRWKGSREIPR